jgi:hypothetical protein
LSCLALSSAVIGTYSFTVGRDSVFSTRLVGKVREADFDMIPQQSCGLPIDRAGKDLLAALLR